LISIIIPTLNEAKALPATLLRVFEQQGDYEVIVADGGSEDETLDNIDRNLNIKVVTAQRGRARQMNAGAAIAKGEWLLFLHADALLPDNALSVISQQRAQAGGFRHRFSGKAWGLAFVSWLHNYRCSRTGVFYGDQAMFVRRSLFVRMNGFPDVHHLEDLLFSEKLLTMTTPIFLDHEVISDSRKFEKKGVWLSLFRVILIQVCHEFKLPIPTRKFFVSVR